MLAHNDVIATIAVRDMGRARHFYQNILGLEPVSAAGDDVTTYKAGDSELYVYTSDFAGGYGATVATWVVDDKIENLVSELREQGVVFEHYENMPGMTLEGDIHVNGTMKTAWFKDPDGNILCLVQS